jgi:nitrogen regulatory protein PII
MKLLVFIVNDENYLEEILEAYVEAGISRATILDSEGMGRFLSYEIPLFAGFKDFMKGNKPYNKTILSVIEDEAMLDQLVPLVEKTIGSLEQPGTGLMFTLPVDWARGISKISKEE